VLKKVLYVNQAIGQFSKQSVSITAVNGG